MRGTRFKQEQIIAILREAKAGVKLSELSRKQGGKRSYDLQAGRAYEDNQPKLHE